MSLFNGASDEVSIAKTLERTVIRLARDCNKCRERLVTFDELLIT